MSTKSSSFVTSGTTNDISYQHYTVPIEINQDYLESLQSSKAFYFLKRPPMRSGGEESLHFMYIPPLNTDIRFSSVLPTFDEPDTQDDEHPEIFDWRHSYDTDTPDITNKKKLISPVLNQGICGSCFAMSSAQVVGDNFVVQGLIDWMPKLSTTYALSCYPQSQCNGGNPAELLLNIQMFGITSDCCIDYSWCKNNPACFSDNPDIEHDSPEDLNKTIPKCGCIDKTCPQFLYFIDQPKSLYIETDDDIKMVKHHILTKGPIITGFFVFENFIEGRFIDNDQGIYFETGDYTTSKTYFDQSQVSSQKYIGSHAVAIIGWGVGKNCIIDNNGLRADVPFWYCRNTWSSSWGYETPERPGDGGYFKMAMYPWNKTAQFEKKVTINDNEAGGLILFNVSRKPTKELIIKESFSKTLNSSLTSATSRNDISISLVIISIILVLFFIILFIKHYY